MTIEADIIKQKQPKNNGGYNAVKFGKTNPLVYEAHDRQPDRPHALAGRQLLRRAHRTDQLRRRVKGANDLAQAVRTAVINKRAGGMGLIVGRKAFQRPIDEGAALINAVQDVYLNPEVTIA